MNKITATAEQVNSDLKIRLLSRTDGRSTSIRLDIYTWDAIEHLASKYGQTWQQWANIVLDAKPETNNMAGELRRAVIHQLMYDTAGAGGVTLPSSHQIVGHGYQRMTDAETERFLKEAHVLHEDRRFTIFSVIIGHHGPSQTPFVCIKNQLLGGLNLLMEQRTGDGI